MAAIANGDGWTPAVNLNLDTAGAAAFEKAKQDFADWAKDQPPLSPVTLQNGWHTITPKLAEDFLRRNTSNRKAALNTVKKYFRAMKLGEWQPTGQPILINAKGKLEDAAHRLWACYLGKVDFRSYVITDVPFVEDLFAYIDDVKARTAADALFTSGTNGLSGVLADAIRLAGRYDDGSLDVFHRQKGSEFSIREVLAYSRMHPELEKATHMVVDEFTQAVEAIGNKPVAAFFAWRVQATYGDDVLAGFLEALVTDTAADSPAEGYRARLLRAERMGEKMGRPHRLALLIKAFLLHHAGKRISKKGLHLLDNEPFPQIEPSALAEAAE